MTGLREKVAESMCARSHDNTRVWQAHSKADKEHWLVLADAAIAVCMEEAAKVAERYQAFPQPKSRAARYHVTHCVKPNIAAALRALRGEGGVDG